jgi:carbohydrate kinase (thermoresistant glucokinase family)
MPHPSIIVMGVSGSGKSTVGALLATRLGLPFIDGDDLHPQANKQKMAAGIPLDDADRAPWLDTIAAALARAPVVVACSALKRRYRDRLRAKAPRVQFIYLAGSPELLAQRLSTRSHEFMPPGLLASQLATLEPPGSNENAFTINIQLSPEAIVDCAVRSLSTSKLVLG